MTFDPKDIVDEASFQAWLESLPRETLDQKETLCDLVLILYERCLLRMLPVAWRFVLHPTAPHQSKISLLPTLAHLLVTNFVVDPKSVRSSAHSEIVNAFNSKRFRDYVNAGELLDHYYFPDKTFDEGIRSKQFSRYLQNAVNTAHALSDPKARQSRLETFSGDIIEDNAVRNDFLQTAMLAFGDIGSVPLISDQKLDEQYFGHRSGAINRSGFIPDVKAYVDGRDLGGAPLWIEDNPLFNEWTNIKSQIDDQGKGEPFFFWIWWYQSLLDGTAPAPDSPMMIDIALLDKDDEGIWEDEPRALKKINEIWRKHQIDQVISQNPLGQRIVRSNKTGLLHSEPVESADLEQVVKDLRALLRRFKSRCQKGHNFGMSIWTSFSPYVEELRSDISKFKNDPRELMRSIERAQFAFERMAQTEGARDEIQIHQLLNGLHDGANDICAAAPEVLEEIKKRQHVELARMSAHQRKVAFAMTVGMTADSEGVLKGALAHALLTIASPEESDTAKVAAWTFLKGSLPRGARALNAAGEKGTDPSQSGSVMDAVVSYADKANKLDKGVDAIQEAVAEATPWGAEVYTQISTGNFWGVF